MTLYRVTCGRINAMFLEEGTPSIFTFHITGGEHTKRTPSNRLPGVWKHATNGWKNTSICIHVLSDNKAAEHAKLKHGKSGLFRGCCFDESISWNFPCHAPASKGAKLLKIHGSSTNHWDSRIRPANINLTRNANLKASSPIIKTRIKSNYKIHFHFIYIYIQYIGSIWKYGIFKLHLPWKVS